MVAISVYSSAGGHTFRTAFSVAAALLVGGCAGNGRQAAIPVQERWEATFQADVEAPEETEFTVTLTAPDGSERTVDGFWNGGSEWRVRFLPDRVGEWSYRTASEPRVAGLDGRSGAFDVVESSGGGPFAQHGAVGVQSGQRYLTYADGTPFFWLGDTGWNGALKSTEEGWRTYLADRLEKGFSVIQLVTTQWRAAPANAEGEVAYSGYERIRIHPEFFDRMDARIDAVNAAGMVAAPVLLWALGDSLEVPGRLPEDQAIRLARYLVARYQGNHVIWILAGDENYARHGQRWLRIGRGVFDRPNHAPVTLHPQGMQWAFDDVIGEPWMDLLIYQSGHGDDDAALRWIYAGPPANAWRSGRALPILNSEPPYEDHLSYQSGQPHPAYHVRRAAYWSLLSGPPAGVTYGAHGVWSWEETEAVPLAHPNSGVARPWSEAIHLPGSDDMKRLGELFRGVEWWRLRPSADLVRQRSDAPSEHLAAAVTDSGDLAVIYAPTGGPVEIDDAAFLTGARAEWFDPRSGTRTAATADDGVYTTPDNLDWILLLTRDIP